MPTYILQKDWICPKFYNRKIILLSGTELIYNGFKYSTKCGHLFDKKVVESNPEWFKLKEERHFVVTEIVSSSSDIKPYTFYVNLNKELDHTKVDKIKEAIEKALNNNSEEENKHNLSLDQLESIYNSVIKHYYNTMKKNKYGIGVQISGCAKEWAEKNKEKFINTLIEIEEIKIPTTGTYNSPNIDITATI